jgi:hypothetical protein
MSTPTLVNGQRIVRLREIGTAMGPFVLMTWGVFDLHAGSRAKPLFKTINRKYAAEIATREGWRYIGPQEEPALA